MLVPVAIPRTTKPPLGTPIDWSNPLAQGLVGAWAFNEGAGAQSWSAVSGAPGIIASGSFVSNGLALSSPTSGVDISSFVLPPYPLSVAFGATLSQQSTNNGRVIQTKTSNSPFISITTLSTGTYGTAPIIQFGNGIAAGNTKRTTTASPSVDGKYHSTVVRFLSATAGNCDAYIDGVSASLVVGDGLGVASTAALYIGNRNDKTLSSLGTYSYFYIFSRALSPTEIASLSSNPWQIYEPEIMWVEVGGSISPALLEGILSGSASTTAALTTAITLAAQSSGSATATANLTTSIALAAQILATGTTAGDLTTAISLAGQSSGQSSTAAALLSAITLAGSSQGISSVTAQLTTAIRLAAIAAGVGSLSGDLAGAVAAAILAGTAAGSSSVDADLLTAIPLAGSALGSGTTQAQLSTAIALAAAAQGDSAAQAALATAISLSAQVNGTSSVAGVLDGALAVLGDIYRLSPEPRIHRLAPEQRIIKLDREQRIYRLPRGHA